MTIAELIKLLKKFPQDLPVAYGKFSEQCLLEEEELSVKELCYPRPDGWIENKRPDKPHRPYFMLPGN